MPISYQGCTSARPAKRLFFLSLDEGSQAPERRRWLSSVLMTQHPLNASRKTYSIAMQEKHTKGLFFPVRFHRKLYHSAFMGRKTSIFSASQFFPRPLTAAVITCSPLPLSPWLAEAKRKKNVSAQFQLFSASRNTHKSHVSLMPRFPVQTHCSSPCPCLAAWIPWVPHCLHSTWGRGQCDHALSLPKPPLIPAHSSPMLNSHPHPSEPGEELQEATAPSSHFHTFSCLLQCPWHGAMGCHGMPHTAR